MKTKVFCASMMLLAATAQAQTPIQQKSWWGHSATSSAVQSSPPPYTGPIYDRQTNNILGQAVLSGNNVNYYDCKQHLIGWSTPEHTFDADGNQVVSFVGDLQKNITDCGPNEMVQPGVYKGPNKVVAIGIGVAVAAGMGVLIWQLAK